jgi:hypothetical protein
MSLALGGLLGVLALAGCGSSSSSSSSSSSAAAGTNSAFITAANGACRTAYAKERALKASSGGAETPKEIASNTAKLATIAQAMLGQLTALTPPASQQAEYNKMLDAWRKEIAVALVRGQAAKAGNAKSVSEDKSKLVPLAEEFDEAATKLDLAVCAGNP